MLLNVIGILSRLFETLLVGRFFGLCLTSELWLAGAVTDLNNKQPDQIVGDFGSDRDLNRWPPPHDSSSGGDLVYCLSAIPSVSFRSNSFTIRAPVPCWGGKCQHQDRETQTAPECPHQLASQTLGLHDQPRITAWKLWIADLWKTYIIEEVPFLVD